MNMNRATRRQFLAGSAAVLGGAMLASSGLAAEGAKKRNIKLAVGYGMVGEGKTVLEKFQALKDAGFHGVEVNKPGGPSNAELIKAKEATGIQIAGIMNSVHWRDTLSDNNPDVREKGRKALEQCLRDCKEIDAGSVLLVPAVVNKNVTFDDAWKRSIEEIRKVIPLCEELKVKIGIENVWNNFLMKPEDAARYIDEINSPWVGFHFDVGNHVKYGGAPLWAKTLGKRIIKLHFKEFGLKKGFGVELLEGDCEWPAVMKELDAVNYSGWAIAEIGGGKMDRLKKINELMTKIIEL